MSRTHKMQTQTLKIENKKKKVAHALRRHADVMHAEYGDETSAEQFPTDAMLEIADWTLDQARIAADDDDHDLATIERVRAFMHGQVVGARSRPPTQHEMLTVIALVIVALEKRHGVTGLGEYVAEVVGQTFDGVSSPPPPVWPPSRLVPPLRRRPRLVPHLYCVP